MESMKTAIYNAFMAVDLWFNREAYIQSMRLNGFLVNSDITYKQLYRFFRQ